MNHRQLFLISILILLFQKSLIADTFVVTSNADSGPGSLREAITLANANGTAVYDTILFNIQTPGFNDRIIHLANELPVLSSNIIIDASSQPGESYAITDAKICLKKDDYATSFSIIKISNARNVKIFSLYFYYGYWQGFFGNPYRSNYLYGINIENSFNIEIGAPRKGNVFNGSVNGIYSNSDSCRNVTIRSNYLGLGPYYNTSPVTITGTDIDQVVLRNDCSINLINVKDITIGGPLPDDGNVISAPRGIDIASYYSTENGFINIQHNIFGRWYDKLTLLSVYDLWNRHINIGKSHYNPNGPDDIDYELTFLDNDVPTHMFLTTLSKPFIIQRNNFIVQPLQMTDGNKLQITKCPGGGLIGSDDASNINLFINRREPYQSSISAYDNGPIQIIKNIFECNSTIGSTTWISSVYNTIPYAQVDKTANNSVSGRATPNSRIDLYYDDECTACEGKIYFATVNSNSDSTWNFIGPISGIVVAIATKNGFSSQFSTPLFDVSKKILKQPTCGLKNGSIEGIIPEGAESYFWVDLRTGDTVSHNINLLNAGPGEYLLYGRHGDNCINSIGQSIVLEDITPRIGGDAAGVFQPSCGRNNGSITGIPLDQMQNSVYEWQDANRNVFSKNLDIDNLAPGVYSLIARDTIVGCSDTAAFVLTNQSGPSLNTDNIQITNATCNNSNGSIKNIAPSNVTGSPFIQWLDSLNNPVSNSIDLLNEPAGKYKLKFKDETGCDTIITSWYTIPSIGSINIDTSGKIIQPADCTANNGAILNISVSGADNYQWQNLTTNSAAGSTNNISLLAAGSYQLTASNSLGCSFTSPIIIVPQAAFSNITATAIQVKDAFCGQNNGMISIQSFNTDPSYYSFTWTDSASVQVIGNSTAMNNLGGGTYFLVATDTNGCKKEILRTLIHAFPKPAFDLSQIIITPDQCSLKKGIIKGVRLTALQGPATYVWIDENNTVVGNSPDLKDVDKGKYQLTVTDKGGCAIQSGWLIIGNIDNAEPAPSYDDIIIPRNSSAALVVKNFEPGNYILYSDPAGTQIIGQNSTGLFTTPVINENKYFYVQHISGSCSSAIIAVKVTVVDKSEFVIPSAFTPNNDGLNDLLRLKVIGHIDVEYFKIYNRYGEEVFSTKTINNGWDGRFKGYEQETAVFVWIAKGKDINGKTIMAKGSFVLIR